MFKSAHVIQAAALGAGGDIFGRSRGPGVSPAASFGVFWQTVTGSLEADETHRQAAVREVIEETGIAAREEDLIDLGLVNTFEIPPPWRTRYAPGVTRNEEVCFALKVGKVEPRMDPEEHDAFAWVCFKDALKMFYWESNRRALAALDEKLFGASRSGARGEKEV
jgi:dihydroneopterin triphosphate diphosphatase